MFMWMYGPQLYYYCYFFKNIISITIIIINIIIIIIDINIIVAIIIINIM